MNVFCCLREDRQLLLGIPSMLEWSIEATPSDGGSVLTLIIDGAKEVHLLGGKPVNLSELAIEVKDFAKACPEAIGPAECVNISHLSENIGYFEVIRCSPNAANTLDENKPTEKTEAERLRCNGRSAFYVWSTVLSYLEEQLGAVTVASWFDDVIVTDFTDERMRIDTKSDFRCEVIKRRCLPLIQQALKEIWNYDTTVEVVAGKSDTAV